MGIKAILFHKKCLHSSVSWSLLICFSHYWFHPWSLWGEKVRDLQAICRQPLRPQLLLQCLLWGASQVPGPGFYQLRGSPHLDHWAEIPHGWYQRRRQFGPEATHPWSISFIYITPAHAQSLNHNTINFISPKTHSNPEQEPMWSLTAASRGYSRLSLRPTKTEMAPWALGRFTSCSTNSMWIYPSRKSERCFR